MADWHRVVHWALVEAGYTPVSNAKARLAYQGVMRAGSFEVPVLLQIDEDMVRAPSIRLLDRPGALSNPLPHIDPDNGLCYLDPQLSRMDPLNPKGMLGACLKKANELLEDLIAGRKDGDAEREFPLLWFPDFPSFSTLRRGFSGPATLFKFEGTRTFHVLAASEGEARKYGCAWRAGEIEIKSTWPAYVLNWNRSVRPNRLTNRGPLQQPSNFCGFFLTFRPGSHPKPKNSSTFGKTTAFSWL